LGLGLDTSLAGFSLG